MIAPLVVCLLVLLALGAAERVARDRAWRSVPIRIHVNGTRAKSTVTRLIWSALREAGIPAIAKTTGTAPRLLGPDGTERPFRRRGPANIREQLALLRLARRAGARAVVVECMAIDPGLQHVTEREMVHATIGVITNVRLDHTEAMGADIESVASTLANTIPAGGVLVIGACRPARLFEDRAAALATRIVTVGRAAGTCTPAARHEATDTATGAMPGWMEEDIALALGVTRQLGIEDTVARRGFALAPPDPGAVRTGIALLRRGPAAWMDATAANDPESLALLAADRPRSGADAMGTAGPAARIVVYNHRPDRAARLACFAAHSRLLADADRLVVTGARPPWTVWRRIGQTRSPRPTVFVPARRLGSWLGTNTPGTEVVFCGNTRGLDVPRVLEEAVSHG